MQIFEHTLSQQFALFWQILLIANKKYLNTPQCYKYNAHTCSASEFLMNTDKFQKALNCTKTYIFSLKHNSIQ